MIFPIDGYKISEKLPATAAPQFHKFIRHYGISNKNTEVKTGSTPTRFTKSFNKEEQISSIISIIRERVSNMLDVLPNEIDPSQKTTMIGVDSLMAIELKVFTL